MGFGEVIVALVAILTLGGVLSAKARAKGDRDRDRGAAPVAEVRAMEAEMQGLKERVQVLERLATDDGARLTHEIERLRDRDRV